MMLKGLIALLSMICIWGMAGLAGAQELKSSTGSTERAIFAGGCFWCMEAPFDKIPGVHKVTVGYTGGTKANPTYKEVSAGKTGHTEAVELVFDPQLVSYKKLLHIFWRQIDPTTPDAQFCDRGSQYRSGIFYLSEDQRKAAEESKEELQKKAAFKGKIVTEITKAGPFYAAEEYHQRYYKKNPIRYKYYRYSCGRDKVLDSLWGADREKS